MAINLNAIKNDCQGMSAGWQQAKDEEFNGITKAEFDADLAECATLDNEIEVDEAALKTKKDRRDDKYRAINQKRVKVGKGVAGHKDFGDDHLVYGAMGFVRKSERKSGLKRSKKNGGTKNGENK